MNRKLKLLREWVGVDENEISDENILKITKGTLIEEKIRFKVAEDIFKQSIKKEIEIDIFDNVLSFLYWVFIVFLFMCIATYVIVNL